MKGNNLLREEILHSPQKSDVVLKWNASRTDPKKRQLHNCTCLHATVCAFILGKFAGSKRTHSASHKYALQRHGPCWGGGAVPVPALGEQCFSGSALASLQRCAYISLCVYVPSLSSERLCIYIWAVDLNICGKSTRKQMAVLIAPFRVWLSSAMLPVAGRCAEGCSLACTGH